MSVDVGALAEALEWWDSFGPDFGEAFPDPGHIPRMVAAARTILEAPTADRLRQAVEDEGPNPRYHREVMERHREEWPALWAAIDEILEMGRVRLVPEAPSS